MWCEPSADRQGEERGRRRPGGSGDLNPNPNSNPTTVRSCTMNVNRNYYEMQVEGHPLAPKEVDVTERQLGRFRELVRRGQGRRDFDDDCYYEGQFAAGEISGQGVYRFNDGSTYEGDFKDGWMHGKGLYTVKARVGGDDSAGSNLQKGGPVHTFEGDYLLGAREGHGTIKYANQIIFQGEVKASRCAGKGKFIFPNGDVYEGDFEADLPHGTGTYTFANGTVYEGEFSKGKMNGKGQFIFPNGAGYDNDEYLLPGMSIPEKLRIKEGEFKGVFIKGAFYEPTLLAPEPDWTALEAAEEAEAATEDMAAGDVAGTAPNTASGEGGGGEGTAPPTAEGGGEDAAEAPPPGSAGGAAATAAADTPAE